MVYHSFRSGQNPHQSCVGHGSRITGSVQSTASPCCQSFTSCSMLQHHALCFTAKALLGRRFRKTEGSTVDGAPFFAWCAVSLIVAQFSCKVRFRVFGWVVKRGWKRFPCEGLAQQVFHQCTKEAGGQVPPLPRMVLSVPHQRCFVRVHVSAHARALLAQPDAI
eukprot:3713332-Amphidinium_carterae.1